MCLTFEARARSVVTMEADCAQHGRAAEALEGRLSRTGTRGDPGR